MQNCGVLRRPGGVMQGDGPLDDRQRLIGVRAGRGDAALHVPQFPRRAGHQRLRRDRHDVVIFGISVQNPPHRVCVVVIPAIELRLRHWMRRLKPLRQSFDQHVLRRRGGLRGGAGALNVAVAERRRLRRFGLGKIAPRHVIEGPRAIGGAPVGHDAVGVMFQRALEALYAFFVVEPKAPVEAEIEPVLRLRRTG